MDVIRKLTESCENMAGFMMTHSMSGGTGSGLGALILSRLSVLNSKKIKMGIEIYPSPNFSTCVVEDYNALLASQCLISDTDINLLFDNESIYRICQRYLNIDRPDTSNVNYLIAKILSSATASMRFNGELNTDLHELVINLVPFPCMHFMTSGMGPILPAFQLSNTVQSVAAITKECFQPSNWFVSFTDFDLLEDRYMAISLMYRGDVQAKEANLAIQSLKANQTVLLVEWCPTGFKIGLNNIPAATLPLDGMAPCSKSCVTVANNAGIARIFQRICKKYDLMYSQRAFVHWYVGEGLSEGFFEEARSCLDALEKDYLELSSEQLSSDEYDETDY
ncbi:hypothetical protein RFI_22343 [Reticulomyxa filosa]|uniref:Tubulin alpha chain n=1 Tax=Reticulomyxa filosa TaxID=46433 RepID=X6MPL2_RETFI|nr:hypothetical protein RFI_22343 [Reticulomyxa filosa]|eukprot:ETO15025.1 hypothetical protein RFI_22343 [Reticulomyxa filosa]